MDLLDLNNVVTVEIKKIYDIDISSPYAYTASFYHYFEPGETAPDVLRDSVSIPKDKFKDTLKYIRDTGEYNELFVDGEFIFVAKKLKITKVFNFISSIGIAFDHAADLPISIYNLFPVPDTDGEIRRSHSFESANIPYIKEIGKFIDRFDHERYIDFIFCVICLMYGKGDSVNKKVYANDEHFIYSEAIAANLDALYSVYSNNSKMEEIMTRMRKDNDELLQYLNDAVKLDIERFLDYLEVSDEDKLYIELNFDKGVD